MKENSGLEPLAGEYKRTQKVSKLAGKNDVYLAQKYETGLASLREQAREIAKEQGLDVQEELAKFGLTKSKVKSVKNELDTVHKKMIAAGLSQAFDHTETDPLIIESFIEEAKGIYAEAGMGEEYTQLLKPFEEAKRKLVGKKEAELAAIEKEQPAQNEIPLGETRRVHESRTESNAKKYAASSRLGRWFNKKIYNIDHDETEKRAQTRKEERNSKKSFRRELEVTGISLKQEKGFLRKMFNRNKEAKNTFTPTKESVTNFVERYKELVPLMPKADSPLAYDMEITMKKIAESAVSAYTQLPEPKDPKMLGPLEKFLPKAKTMPLTDTPETGEFERAA